MKKNLFYGFLFVIFMVTTFGMTSCEKDDDGGESGTLYRNWKSTENEGFFNIKKDGTLSFLSVNGVVTAKYKITSSVKQGVDFFEAKLVTKYTLELNPAIELGGYTFVKFYVYHIEESSFATEQIKVVVEDNKGYTHNMKYFFP